MVVAVLASVSLALAARALHPWGPQLLAPGPQELGRELNRMGALVDDAEVMGVASGRLQNRWAERLQSGFHDSPCKDELLSSLGLRTRIFVSAERDATQAARAQLDRLRTLAARSTVRPLVDPATEREIAALGARVEVAGRAWMERATWQQTFVDPAFAPCVSTLRTADGVGTEAPLGPGEGRNSVAVAGTGGGTLCPSGLAADGRIVVLDSPFACYGEAGCDCAPSLVLPGAVLGPELPLAEPPRTRDAVPAPSVLSPDAGGPAPPPPPPVLEEPLD